ncbi:uncharacterized protein PG998_008985 [Apiospora kogelbergensis]|uniref:uncharacterized protein n=1 Tax=Apiospora kogelbergensis TaxID=1337665 RepID=UPI00312E7167
MLFDQVPPAVPYTRLARRVRALARRHGRRRRRDRVRRKRRGRSRRGRRSAVTAMAAVLEPDAETHAQPNGHEHHGEQREDGEEGEPGHAADAIPLGGRGADGHGVGARVDGLEAAAEAHATTALFGRGTLLVVVVAEPPVIVLAAVRRVFRERRVLLLLLLLRLGDGLGVGARGAGGVVLEAVRLDDFGGVVGAPVGLLAVVHFG